MTQRDRILYELRQAGEAGVRGDTFLKLSMPRYAARILELRKEGHDIRTEDDSGMARYRLYEIVGVGAECSSRSGNAGRSGYNRTVSVDSGEQRGVTRRSTNEHTGYEDNPITAGIARRPGRTEEPGDKSEVPAAASSDSCAGQHIGKGVRGAGCTDARHPRVNAASNSGQAAGSSLPESPRPQSVPEPLFPGYEIQEAA